MIVTLDFETFYDQNYSLRKLSEVDYVLHPLFQTIMCAVKLGDAPTQICFAPKHGKGLGLQAVFASIDWESTALLCHNTRFDGAILYWHYGIKPALYLDTLSMARALTHPLIGSSSLERVSRYMGLPPKGDAVVRAMGKRVEDFTQAELDEYGAYCQHDTELCRTIFDRFMSVGFPKSELAVIDIAMRAFIEPQARLDENVLAQHLNQVRADKASVMAQLSHIPPDVFSSNKKFAELLETLGVDVPRKISPTTGQETYALSKNDRAFKELCADPSQPAIVQAACACRLNVKSTIEETRTATMLNLSLREWSDGVGSGWMPVPYRYYGAHTGRFSADGGFNFANLRRGSRIREAITAPPGYRVVHRDASQIECRTLATLAGCTSLMAAFRDGRDVYSEFASRFYHRQISKQDKQERFVGKTCVLGLGYGMGPPKLRHTLFIGNGGISVDLDEVNARNLVYFYRGEYLEIPQFWANLQVMIERMILAKRPELPQYNFYMSKDPPPFRAVEFVTDAIRLPNGLAIQYPDLRQHMNDKGEYEFIYDAHMEHATKKIYGAKMAENITQALTRIMLTDVARRVQHETGFRPFMSTYDSHDYIVPEDQALPFDRYLEAQFARPPAWLPDVPLASEGGWGRNLLEAEKGANV